MAMNLTNQVRSIAEVPKAVTSGDLTKVIEVDVRGELLDLNKTVNWSLSDFAGQVTRVVREVGTEGLLGRRANVMNVSGAWKVRPCPFQISSFDRSNFIILLTPGLDGLCECDGR
jgi:osomolarity two-component system, sensor histidine kinase NIK1